MPATETKIPLTGVYASREALADHIEHGLDAGRSDDALKGFLTGTFAGLLEQVYGITVERAYLDDDSTYLRSRAAQMVAALRGDA